MVALTHWVCFLFFSRGQLTFWPLVSLWYFGGSFVWVAFLFAGELFLLYTAELSSRVENKLYGYANDSTLVAVVSSPGERVAVSESMNRDLNRVNVWCNL